MSSPAPGEFGDDSYRYATAKSRNELGQHLPPRRRIRQETRRARSTRPNRRLYNAIDRWGISALIVSPDCRTFYDQRRTAGDLHNQALRALGDRLIGILHGCLRHREFADEHGARSQRQPADNIAARRLTLLGVSNAGIGPCVWGFSAVRERAAAV